MATSLFYTSSSYDLYLHQLRRRRLLPSLSSFSHFTSPVSPFPSPSHLRLPTPLLLANSGAGRCLAVAPGPPSPPGPDPPPPGNTTELGGLAREVSRIRDRVKIFLAVLFWMSLFFWSSSSDGRGKGKRKKSSRFK